MVIKIKKIIIRRFSEALMRLIVDYVKPDFYSSKTNEEKTKHLNSSN